ncbi:AbgT family transporter [Psychrobacillus lasiicapitis]|uniref:AbgT family transporter n=1 Tax=Psychrobacillus lasiicapitis TaxID=1636719 RepID=A0A544T718_9BACI|nr:AbgT family transporter [Psychrobacillus lasiicapitis]TQR13240.1 AbgT family transporter [Psychrobacillus lasiicapitis]GGA33301.1 aminobenzoyl-glutamate transporter [Psychrobacillus lasiicapitis]
MQQVFTKAEKNEENRFSKFLSFIEKVGNKLPHPFILFFYLTVLLVILSWILSLFKAAVVHPNTQEMVAVKSIISGEGIQFILSDTLKNFTGFAPLGLVLTIMLGIGLAEKVGLLEMLMKRAILSTPKKIITFAVFFIGILGNVASDAAFVVIPPLAALVFLSVGRHPIAGLAVGLASTGIGFSANILIAGTDALLSGISTEISKGINPDVIVTPLDNWFFMSISTFVLAALGTLITEKYVEPRLGVYKGEQQSISKDISPLEKRGLRNSFISAIVFIAVIVGGMLIPNSPLLNEDGTILRSPFLSGIVPILFLFFLVVGITYGVSTKKIQSSADIPKLMTEAIGSLSGYIVLIFMIAQFVAYFNWSNIAIWLAVHSADLLTTLNMTNVFVIVLFVLLTAFLSLFIISGSALWSLVGPVFVPLFMVLGYHPAFIQLAYRIGESSTNMVTPLNPYFAIILSFMHVYDKKAGIGTLMSLMIPYTIGFLIIWTILMLVFALFGIPIGPGVSLYL